MKAAGIGGFELLAIAGALSAAEETDVLDALLERPASADALAARLRLERLPARRLLELLERAGFAHREGEEFAAAAPLRELAAAPGGLAGACQTWRALAPALRGERDTWSSDDSPRRGARYHELVEGLDRIFEPGARELAGALGGPPPAAILDLGAGAGVWGLALLDRFASARLTAVDLPEVVEVLRRRAEARGLSRRLEARGGDFFRLELPAAFDLAIIGNVLRILPAERAEELVRRAAGALQPGGRLVVVDVMDADDPDVALRRAAYRLHLSMRADSTGPYSADQIRGWMRQGGLELVERRRLSAAPMRETALIARR